MLAAGTGWIFFVCGGGGGGGRVSFNGVLPGNQTVIFFPFFCNVMSDNVRFTKIICIRVPLHFP